MSNNYFIVLGGGKDQLYLIKNIKLLNYKLIVVDRKKNCPGFDEADIAVNIDFIYTKKVILKLIKLRKEFNLNYLGVITMGVDVPYIVSKIAKKFGLFHNSYRSAKVSQNKILMKKLFKKVGISYPAYRVVKNYEQILNFWKKNGCKYLVIKPADSSGSKGVQVIFSKSQIKPAINNVKKNTKKKNFIIEELIEGPQLSTESILVKKKIFTPGIVYRDYSDIKYFLPQILENGATAPSKYKRYQSEIEKVKKKIGIELKFHSGIIKGDFVIKNNKLLIIEFTTRLSGGDFSESLAPLSNGINYVKQAIKIAAKDQVKISELKSKFSKTVVNRYFFLPKGKLLKISGLDKLKKIKEVKKIDFYYDIKSKIPKIDSHGKRVGVFIIVSKDKKKINKIIDKVYRTVRFNVSNKWYLGFPSSLNKNKKKLNIPSINMM